MKSAFAASMPALESLDGASAADHDVPHVLSRTPRAPTLFPFSTRQFVRLLILRGRMRNELNSGDTPQ
jgi:hypothetical protein